MAVATDMGDATQMHLELVAGSLDAPRRLPLNQSARLATGPAEISYFERFETPLPGAKADATRGVQVSAPLAVLDGDAIAGSLVVSSKHSTSGGLESSFATTGAPQDVGAGLFESSWSSSFAYDTRTIFASADVGLVSPGYVATGVSTIPAASQMRVTGAATQSLVIFTHVSMAVNLSALGYDVAPDTGIFSVQLDPGHPRCVTVAAVPARCLE